MFCVKCGKELKEGARFCIFCGAQVADKETPAVTVVETAMQMSNIQMFEGNEKKMSFLNETLSVPRDVCLFNYYRKEFFKLAKIKKEDLRREYTEKITNLDSFLCDFPQMYIKHLNPILKRAHELIIAHGVYDLSLEQLTSQHTTDFCLCQEDIDVMIESFNKTIEANQDRKIRAYNMLPGVVFRGLGGFAAALAMNVAVNAIAKADIERANVTPKQRAELFARINVDILMERAFLDFWRVFLSLTWQLKEHGASTWYLTDEHNQRATGIYQNLMSGLIPNERKPQLIVSILQANPYLEGLMEYLTTSYPNSEDVKIIQDFFSIDC